MEGPRLINGTRMTCPRCRASNDVLRFVPLEQVDEFQGETAPIYKCPECRHLFAPIQEPNGNGTHVEVREVVDA